MYGISEQVQNLIPGHQSGFCVVQCFSLAFIFSNCCLYVTQFFCVFYGFFFLFFFFLHFHSENFNILCYMINFASNTSYIKILLYNTYVYILAHWKRMFQIRFYRCKAFYIKITYENIFLLFVSFEAN